MEDREKTHWQWDKLIPLWICLAALILLNLFQGNSKVDSLVGIGLCSVPYWLVYAAFILLSGGVGAYAIVKGKKEYAIKKSIGCLVQGDVEIKGNKVLFYCLIAGTGGLLAATVGMSGSIVYGPLLLELNLHPKVSSGTSMYLVLYTAISSSIQYAISGSIIWIWGVWVGFYVVVGTLLGTTLVNKAIKKSGRSSIIVLILFLVILLAIFGSGTVDTIGIIQDAKDGKNVMEFGSIC